MSRFTITAAIMFMVVSSQLYCYAAEQDGKKRDVVVHADGALQFKLPLHWHLAEKPQGRQTRLLITDAALPKTFQPKEIDNLSDLFWITYHRKTRSVEPASLKSLAIENLRHQHKASIKLGRQSSFKVHRYSGIEQFYSFNGASKSVSNSGSQTSSQTLQAAYWLLPTNYGLLEMKLIAPKKQFVSRLKKVDALIDSMTLAKPKHLTPKVQPQFNSAKSIVGPWKSLGGKLQITGDGYLSLRNDNDLIRPIDESGSRNFDNPQVMLIGKYQASGNLLKVTWQDGSRTNYRWKLSQDDLFLTDHTGRVSQLKRQFE